MPTGGVSPTLESLQKWFDAGVTCVGMGSKLIEKDSEGNFNYQKSEQLVQFSISIIKNLRKKNYCIKEWLI